MNLCYVCGRGMTSGGLVHIACQKLPVEMDEEDTAMRKRLIAITTSLCQYATEFRAKLIRECDERNKV